MTAPPDLFAAAASPRFRAALELLLQLSEFEFVEQLVGQLLVRLFDDQAPPGRV